MVVAYHVIFTAYGFWLPNDPRGSWSDFVAAWDLVLAAGKATKTDDRHSVAHTPHDRNKRLAAKNALKYPPVQFTGQQALAIAHGFIQAVCEAEYVIYACSILPRHLHLVVARETGRDVEKIVGHLKAKASSRLRVEGVHPFAEYATENGAVPTVWAQGCWKVFLNTPEDVARAVRYVEENAEKEGKPMQRWSFVRPFGQ